MYLEGQQKLHHDISYTNHLLQESGGDAKEIQSLRNQIMVKLELSRVEELQKEYKCREGLLIDYDYGVDMGSEDVKEDVIAQGEEVATAQDEEDVIAQGEEDITQDEEDIAPDEEESGMHPCLQVSMKYLEKVSGLQMVFL